MKKKPNYVIVRTNRAGVFFGELVEEKPGEVTLTNYRKLFYWEGAAAVEELANSGTKNPNSCKFTVWIDRPSKMADPIQIIPCTNEAIESIKSVKEWRA